MAGQSERRISLILSSPALPLASSSGLPGCTGGVDARLWPWVPLGSSGTSGVSEGRARPVYNTHDVGNCECEEVVPAGASLSLDT